ncbi:DgyrCDS13039 [Dimorphilus gyrociliatus]|uniref:DgyrCDS13039 n=1 Tax=Dimorphilus gyrociliatus TaxID=2664684 RepID=A0A7I8W9J0_9ANNE|nr:DgyrCDS13039 [Dimorphilus gyrociliatus]
MFHRQYFLFVASIAAVFLVNTCYSASYIAKHLENDSKKIDEKNTVLDKLHLGCFKDKADDKDLPQHIWASDTNTIKSCIDGCRQQGFRFAGVQNARDCFCGNNLHRKHSTADNCNKHCPGNGGQICGGENANNVYNVPKDPRYNGCYQSAFNTILWDKRNPQAARHCIEACAKNNKMYASVREGDCKCSDEFPATSVQESECSVSCPRYFMENCGGKNADAIYETELAQRLVAPYKRDMVKLYDPTGSVRAIQTSLFSQYPKLRSIITKTLVIHSETTPKIPLKDPICSDDCYKPCGRIYHPEGLKDNDDEVILRFFFFNLKNLPTYVGPNAKKVYIYAQTILLEESLTLTYSLHIKTRQLFINYGKAQFINIANEATMFDFDMNTYKLHGPNQDMLHARQSWMCSSILLEENPNSQYAFAIMDYIGNAFSDIEEAKDLFGSLDAKRSQITTIVRKNIRPVPFYSKQFFLHLLDNYYNKISIYDSHFNAILVDTINAQDFREKVREMIDIHSNANIEDASLALSASLGAIERSNATYWRLKKHYEEARANALYFGEAFNNNTVNATNGQIETALDKFVKAIETVLEGIEDFDHDDLEESINFLVDGFIGLAETLKNLADTVRTVMHFFQVSEDLMKDLEEANNATTLKSYADILERSSRLQISVIRWNLLKNSAVTLLSHEAVNLIPGSQEYRDSLIIVCNWGEALTRAMVEKAELMRDALEKRFTLQNKQLENKRYKELFKLLEQNFGNKDKVLKAMAEQTYEVRLDLNAILIQFCRAYFYENLQVCKDSSRPNFGESLSQLLLRINAARRDGLLLPDSPSTINRIVKLTDKPGQCSEAQDCPLKFLKRERAILYTINTNRPELNDLHKFRVSELEITLPGAKSTGENNILKILIQCSGLYQGKNRGQLYNFLTRPLSLTYEYNLENGFVSIKADVYKPFRNIINHITPYTTWQIRVSPDRSSDIDLSEVKSIDIKFIGYATANLQ